MIIDGIKVEIELVDTLEGSPARCTIVKPNEFAIIKLAKDKCSQYNKETRTFIILHELGHAVLNSGDELAVDQWAFKQYKKTKLPLKQAVFALSKILDGVNSEEHSQRIIRQFYRAKHENFLRGNATVKQFLNQKHKL